MSNSFQCARCAKAEPRLPQAPLPGAVGEELLARVCADCWNEWREMEVRVINELRLNFMDPDAQEKLDRQMRAFLFPGDAPTPS